MSYQQGSNMKPGAAPYPQQQYQPPPSSGGAPYPPTSYNPPNNTPYPPTPLYNIGFVSKFPMEMPQPLNIPVYAPSAPSARGEAYPPPAHLPPNISYPSSGSYPPPANTNSPQNTSSGGCYRDSSSTYSSQNTSGSRLPSSRVYLPLNGGDNKVLSNTYRPQTTTKIYPPAGYPPSNEGYPTARPLPSSKSYLPAPGAPSGGRGSESLRGLYGGVFITNRSAAHGEHPQATYQPPKRTPTVHPAPQFNPRDDAEALRAAMKGWGCDDKALVYILAHRCTAQRLQIEKEYKVMFGRDLVEDLKSETKGNLETLLVAMVTPLPFYYAKELHHAMAGLGTDESVLIEILCTKSNAEIMTIRKAYHILYKTSLESDLKGDTGGHFKRLMVSLCNAARDESMVTDPVAAKKDAEDLFSAGENRLGTDESTFNMVLCQRNWAQLQLIFQEYQNLTGHDIEKAIKDEFSGDIERGLLAVIRSIKNQAAFFAKLLNESMKGLGTNDRSLIRLVVTRSEIDMVEIKREYEARYRETLADAIKGDTSGNYKKCLLALIGEDS